MKILFEKMDEYSRHAYLYSTWTAMLIPCVLATAMIYHAELIYDIHSIWKMATTGIPVVVFLASGFFLRERVRDISKKLFQFPLFKEDETHMPTTDFMMWSSEYPDEMKQTVRKKVKKDFNYAMPSKEDERKDENAARRNIAAIIGSIRAKARNSGDAVYTQANYRYGYNRNLLGGLVLAFLITFGLMLVNVYIKSISIKWFVISLIVIVLWVIVEYYLFYKQSARSYARQLFDTYLAL